MNEKIKAIVDGMLKEFGEEETLGAIVKAEQKTRLQKLKNVENPWKRRTFNLTQQAAIKKKDPDLAVILEEEARQ